MIIRVPFLVVLSVVLSCSVTHVFLVNWILNFGSWLLRFGTGTETTPFCCAFNPRRSCPSHVEQPANPAFPVQTLNIPANGTQTLDLTPWLGDIENKPSNTTLNRGLHITSDAPVTAYYEINHNLNPDIFALKGSSALGDAFYVPFQNYLDNYYTQSKAAIDLIATEDNTEITVVPTVALAGYPAGTPFTITLDSGETYGLRAANAQASNHPAGTYITSAPIAITMSDDSVLGFAYPPGNCQDILLTGHSRIHCRQ